MKTLLGWATFALLTLSQTSCLELQVGLTLNADGSGTQTLHLGMSDAVLKSVRASARALDASNDRPDPLAVFDREKVTAELAGLGLTVERHETKRERRREQVDVTAGFDSFATLRKSTLFGAEGEWFVLAGRNPGGKRLVFYPRGHAAWLAAKEQAKSIRMAPSAVQQQFFATQKKRIEGLEVDLSLTLPGDVDYSSSNLVRKSKRTVVSAVRAMNIRTAEDLVLALAPRFEVEFDGVGCRVSIDLADPGLEALRKAAAVEASGR